MSAIVRVARICGRHRFEAETIADGTRDHDRPALDNLNGNAWLANRLDMIDEEAVADDSGLTADRHELVMAGPFDSHILKDAQYAFTRRGKTESFVTSTTVHPCLTNDVYR
jgi:hypothetical protein